MRTMRVALAAAVIASLAACAPSPSASAGDVLVPLDLVPYVLEVPESLGARREQEVLHGGIARGAPDDLPGLCRAA